MGVHIYHEDTHTHGLCDECPECIWKARTGVGLDQDNMHRLVVRREHHTATDRRAYATLRAKHPHLETYWDEKHRQYAEEPSVR